MLATEKRNVCATLFSKSYCRRCAPTRAVQAPRPYQTVSAVGVARSLVSMGAGAWRRQAAQLPGSLVEPKVLRLAAWAVVAVVVE